MAMALSDEEEADLRAQLAALQAGPSTGAADPDTQVIVEAPAAPSAEIIAAEAEAATAVIAAQANAQVKVIGAQTESATAIVEAEAAAHAAEEDGGLLAPESQHWYFAKRKRRRDR